MPTVNCPFSGTALTIVITFGATNDCPALSNASVDVFREVLDVASNYDIVCLGAKTKRQVDLATTLLRPTSAR